MSSSKNSALKVSLLAFFGFFILVGLRFYAEAQSKVLSKKGNIISSDFDPRNKAIVERIIKQREKDSFQERIQQGASATWTWPGLRAFQSTINWVQLLNGLHNESSYQGNYSWIFSKLYNIIDKSPRSEAGYLTGIAPYFFVVGKDLVGASILLNELTERADHYYNTWFWGGFHAAENLFDNVMASEYYLKAASFPKAPPYLKDLSAKLKDRSGYQFDSNLRKKIIKDNLDEESIDNLKKINPDLVK